MGNNKWLASGEIYGVISAPSAPPRGSGKSLVALQLAIEQADMLGYGLCANFDLDATALYNYAYHMRYFNFCRQIDNNRVFVRSVVFPNEKGVMKTDLSRFVLGDRLVFILDEAGIFANSHNWRDMSDEFKANLALLRKFRIRLWWVAQYHTQVASALRDQTNYIIECSSILKASKNLGGASEIWVKIYYVYIKLEYEVLYNKRERLSPFKYAIRRFFGAKIKRFTWFSDVDLLTFKIYSSFGKIGDRPSLLNSKRLGMKVLKVTCDSDEYFIFCCNYDCDRFRKRQELKFRRLKGKRAIVRLREVRDRYLVYHQEIAKLSREFWDYDSFFYRYQLPVAKLACEFFGIW